MAKTPDPDAFIASLTPTQLDALNERLAARRAELGAQPVVCANCNGLGIERQAEYGNSSSVHRCRTCRGQGFVGRAQANAGAADWEPAVAMGRVLTDVVRQGYKMTASAQKDGSWKVTGWEPGLNGDPWTISVTLVPGSNADYRLTGVLHSISGAGELWLTIRHR